MLVFLARAARTGCIAADRRFNHLATRVTLRKRRLRNVERRQVRQNGARRRIDVGSIIVARERIEVLGDEVGQHRRRRFFKLHLRTHQDAGHFLADRHQQPLEQQEGLLLILVDRLFLRVAAQVDDLAQRVERREMLLPVMVERLDQNLLLDVVPALAIDLSSFDAMVSSASF